jgi:predicted amidophosphoribosyltransferase
MDRLAPALAAAGDLLLGARCAGCDRAWWGACPDCRALVAGRRPYPTRPDPMPPGFPPTITAGPYDEVARGLITAHKEEQALQLTRLLGGALAGAVADLAAAAGLGRDDPVVLVPVPSAAAAVRRRGFDATGALARRAVCQLRGAYPRVTT